MPRLVLVDTSGGIVKKACGCHCSHSSGHSEDSWEWGGFFAPPVPPSSLLRQPYFTTSTSTYFKPRLPPVWNICMIILVFNITTWNGVFGGNCVENSWRFKGYIWETSDIENRKSPINAELGHLRKWSSALHVRHTHTSQCELCTGCFFTLGLLKLKLKS